LKVCSSPRDRNDLDFVLVPYCWHGSDRSIASRCFLLHITTAANLLARTHFHFCSFRIAEPRQGSGQNCLGNFGSLSSRTLPVRASFVHIPVSEMLGHGPARGQRAGYVGFGGLVQRACLVCLPV